MQKYSHRLADIVYELEREHHGWLFFSSLAIADHLLHASWCHRNNNAVDSSRESQDPDVPA